MLINLFTGKHLYLDDLEDVDPQLLNSLRWILDNSVEGIGQYFTYEIETLGKRVVLPLKPGGESIELTDENKREFVRLICQRKLTDETGAQIRAFKKGFQVIMPDKALKLLGPSELEHVIAGEQVFNVADWKKNATYSGLTVDSDHAEWFWEILESFTNAELSHYLYFVTGKI